MHNMFSNIFLFWQRENINCSELEGSVTILQNYSDIGLPGKITPRDFSFFLSYKIAGKTQQVAFIEGIPQKISLH